MRKVWLAAVIGIASWSCSDQLADMQNGPPLATDSQQYGGKFEPLMAEIVEFLKTQERT